MPKALPHRLKCLAALLVALFVLVLCLNPAAAITEQTDPGDVTAEQGSPDRANITEQTDPSTEATPVTYRVPIIIRADHPIANDPALINANTNDPAQSEPGGNTGSANDTDIGYQVDYLVDHYPVQPARQIYLLVPGRQYRFQLDLSDHQDRPVAIKTSICVSFVSSLPDNRIGLINFDLTETYPDGTEAHFHDRLAFMADCPEGISLSLVQTTPDCTSAESFSFTLEATAGQISRIDNPDQTNQTAQNSQPQVTSFQSDSLSVCISGSPQYVSYSPELDPDLVQWYLWPDGEYTYDYPWPGGEPNTVEAVG